MLSLNNKFGSLECAVDAVIKFHSKSRNTPGIIMGVYMVDFGLKKFYEVFSDKKKNKGGESLKFNAVCETDLCLPDPIQFLLNLTSGNGHLKIINKSGKFAYSLYDREDGNGVRVFIDIKNISPEKFPNIFKFFTRTRDNKVHTDKNFREESNKNIAAEFLNAEEKERNKIFGWEKVHVKLPKKPDILPAKICSVCKESFLSRDAKICFECAGDSYYELI